MVEPALTTDNLREQLLQAQRLHNAGDLAAAIDIYRAIIAIWPNQPDALYRLGVIALQMNNLDLALQLFDRTLIEFPAYAVAHTNRAVALRKQNRSQDALTAAETAIAIDSANAEAWDMVACLRRERGEETAALMGHRRALELQPANAKFFNNLAITQAKSGDYAAARVSVDQAVALLPNDPALWMTRGNILGETGELPQAVDCYRRAQELDSRHGEAVQSEARTQLALGNCRTGWTLMQQRPLITLCNERLTQLPRWHGQRLKHLLLVAEQGYGDAIMFLRYIDQVKSRVDDITLVLPAALHRLAQANYPGLRIVEPHASWPNIDAFELLLSLPFHCQTDTATIPAPIPYLRPLPDSSAIWSDRLQSCKRPAIGLVWAGNAVNAMDHRRSIPAQKLKPLIDHFGAHLVSLQLTGLEAGMAQAGVMDAAPQLKDFADTAALLSRLDLLITIDSAPAHLAAAMGMPVWLMLAYAPDWRWMLEREDSPWYPSVTLLRQPRPGDWDAVVANIVQRLQDR